MENALDTATGDTLDTVLERLTETIAWCRPRVDVSDPRNCLRTVRLRPRPLEGSRKAVVESVAGARYMALNHPPKRKVDDLADGRLLIYDPGRNLFDGLAEDETAGYVDVDNIPPWDTWIAYISEPGANYLLSWVAPQFISLVSAGIAVDPAECIQWLDDSGLSLSALLRKEGLMAP